MENISKNTMKIYYSKSHQKKKKKSGNSAKNRESS